MTTFNTALGELDGARLQALVEPGLRQRRQFEFKAQLPGGSDDEKRENDLTGKTSRERAPAL
jgi:hypothetical protein